MERATLGSGRSLGDATLDHDEGTESLGTEADETSIVVGIPAYNEEIAIGSVILRSQQHADAVIVVDDGSDDRTVDVARAAGAHVIEHRENSGKGAAVRTLLGYAHREYPSLEALVLIDGDGQHDPDDIPNVIEPVLNDQCDLAIGSRYCAGATETPLYRRFGQKLLDMLTAGPSGTRLSDTQSGFRVMSPDAISRINIRTDGMGVESEMISTATDRNLSIREVPIDVRYEGVDGQTHTPIRHGLEVVLFLLQLIRANHPILFFGVPGLFALTTGGVLVGVGFSTQVSAGTINYYHVLGMVLIVLGAVGVLSGILLDRITQLLDGVTDGNSAEG